MIDNKNTEPWHSVTIHQKKEGIKYDSEKVRYDLVPYYTVEQVAKILTFGATKYGDYNWKDLENPFNRYYAACMRHLVDWRKGVKVDEETGVSHLAHAITNLLFMLEIESEDGIISSEDTEA